MTAERSNRLFCYSGCEELSSLRAGAHRGPRAQPGPRGWILLLPWQSLLPAVSHTNVLNMQKKPIDLLQLQMLAKMDALSIGPRVELSYCARDRSNGRPKTDNFRKHQTPVAVQPGVNRDNNNGSKAFHRHAYCQLMFPPALFACNCIWITCDFRGVPPVCLEFFASFVPNFYKWTDLFPLSVAGCVVCSRTLFIRASWSSYIPKIESSLRCSSTGGRRSRRTPPRWRLTKPCSQVSCPLNLINTHFCDSLKIFPRTLQ